MLEIGIMQFNWESFGFEIDQHRAEIQLHDKDTHYHLQQRFRVFVAISKLGAKTDDIRDWSLDRY